MNKYIVKNCPARDKFGLCWNGSLEYCEDCTNCLIKQVIELCNDDLKPIREWQEGDTIFVEYKKDVHLARDILQLFDIEEVE